MRRYLKSMILIIIVVFAIVITLMPYPRSQVIMTTASWIESFKVVGRSEGVAVEFGKPADSDTTEDFPEITLYGRTYGKYFEEEDLYIVFYIQAMDLSLVQLTDDLLLSKSGIIN